MDASMPLRQSSGKRVNRRKKRKKTKEPAETWLPFFALFRSFRLSPESSLKLTSAGAGTTSESPKETKEDERTCRNSTPLFSPFFVLFGYRQNRL
jgi:hypothetical protein